jgi:hypothetical protein
MSDSLAGKRRSCSRARGISEGLCTVVKKSVVPPDVDTLNNDRTVLGRGAADLEGLSAVIRHDCQWLAKFCSKSKLYLGDLWR